jgi:hypothetical protein
VGRKRLGKVAGYMTKSEAKRADSREQIESRE